MRQNKLAISSLTHQQTLLGNKMAEIFSVRQMCNESVEAMGKNRREVNERLEKFSFSLAEQKQITDNLDDEMRTFHGIIKERDKRHWSLSDSMVNIGTKVQTQHDELKLELLKRIETLETKQKDLMSRQG